MKIKPKRPWILLTDTEMYQIRMEALKQKKPAMKLMGEWLRYSIKKFIKG